MGLLGFIKERKFFFLGSVVILALSVIPFIIRASDPYFLIHDNLDSDFIYIFLLIKNGKWLNFSSNSIIYEIMNGLPRSAFRTGINSTFFLFYIFGPFYGYIVNYLIVHLAGFVGMYLVLKRYLITESKYEPLIMGTAICFAMLPVFAIYGLSVTGQPLLLFAFLNILNRTAKPYHYIIILLFPFFAYFILSAVAITALLFFIFVFAYLKKKEAPFSYLIWLGIMVVIWLLFEYPLVSSFVEQRFVSHRNEFDIAAVIKMSTSSSLMEIYKVFIQGHIHSSLVNNSIIIFTIFLSSYLWTKGGGKSQKFWLLLISILLIIVSHGFYYQVTESFKLRLAFNIDRFHFVLPLLWHLLFAIALLQIFEKWRIFAYCLLTFQCVVVLFYNSEFSYNTVTCLNKHQLPGYKTFFDPDTFSEVKKYINRPTSDFRVVAFQMHPSVLQFNDFYTLDGYQNNYLLSYKKKFRNVIAGELEKDKELKQYFDRWGNRCYLYTSENWKEYNRPKLIKNLDIDIKELKKLGCEFIISGDIISNARDIKCSLQKVFNNSELNKKIYLYKIN